MRCENNRLTDLGQGSVKIKEINEESQLLDWFSDFEEMDSVLLQDGVEFNNGHPMVKSQAPSITFKNLGEFIKYLEENNCDDIEVSPCSKSHTFNRPVSTPRLIIKPTWCVYGNSLNTEFFFSCLKDKTCGDIIVDHFEPLVSTPTDFLLSKGGQRILDTPNAGGSSVWSEVLSFEVLNHVFGAQLRKTETEIEYAPGSKITDFSVDINNSHIGVSVVRIINFFDLNGRTYKAVFTPEYARNLLYKKLFGVIASTEAVVEKWEKQILYVWTTSSCVADIIVQEYWKVPAKLRSNTLVYVNHATNSEFLF